MKRILFFTSESLNNPKRGTPIRIWNILEQLSRAHAVWLAASAIPENSKVKAVAYPAGNSFRQAWSLGKIVRNQKIEILMMPTEINIIVPVLVKWLTGVKIVTDLHGLYAEELYFQGLIGGLKRWLIDRGTKFFLRFFNLIVVCSPKLKQYYHRLDKKIVVIYEGVDDTKFFKVSAPSESPVFTIGYAGNTKSYQGLDLLLQACHNLKQKNVFAFRLRLILSSGTTHIHDILQGYGLSEITDLYLKVGQDEVNTIMGQSSVLVVPRPSIKMTEYAYPSKITKDLISGIPTITTDVGPVSELFGSSNCCVIIDSKDIVPNLEKALESVYHMSPNERRVMGDKAANFVKRNLTWDILGHKLNSIIEQL